ncbi:MAG: acetate--CoA ligase family protein [Planctomycetes bacterium]|nr:acetate--CoA ligase family protein [Planctomycetota bacterium]
MLDALFSPKSIAVIGASNRPLTIGYRITQNLKDIGFKGPIYPVHPKDPEINSLKAYPSITQVPGEVDLAHIVVKNTMVPAMMEECGKKGVKFVIINTAGFKEIGGDGIELEKQIKEIAKKYNIRIFGPNCQGVMNSDTVNPTYANFTFTKIKPGHISILAQSGGVGEVINQRLYQLDVGIRMYASNGNAADISIPEILEFWGNDEKTRVIVLHVESLSNPREFMRVCKAITNRKPILGMKTGRTAMGARAVMSHTGSLMKADTSIEAIFDKCGIISFKNQEEICQAAIAFASQPIPKGPNVGILTNTGGPAIIATDECIEGGLSLPDLSEGTKKHLKANLFPEATVSNPVDVLATAGPKEFAVAVESMLKDENIDSLLVNFVTPFFVDCAGVAKEMVRIAQAATKPIVINTMTDKTQWKETMDILKAGGLPTYDLAENAAKALVAMTKYGEYQRKQDEPVASFADTDKKAARQIIEQAKKRCCEFLSLGEALGVLYAYKIPATKFTIADTAEDIMTSADYVGYPMVLKVDSADIIHKTDKGGVALNIMDKKTLKEKVDSFQKQFKGCQFKYMAQEYLTKGREVIIGASHVEGLGHLVMFGLGGVFVEVLKDVSFKVAPLSEHEARGMIQSIKGFAILKGTRGEKGVDLNRLAEFLMRVSQLLTDCPEIRELDLNPIMLYPEKDKCKVVDVRIRI